MVLLDSGINLKGEMSMNAVKAGRVNGRDKTSKPKRANRCVHQRMVEPEFNEKGLTTRNVVCRECGAVIPDPAKVLR